MLNEMLTGYKVKDRFRELSETYSCKRRNVELRQQNDRELQQAQDQVDFYRPWHCSCADPLGVSEFRGP